MKHKMKRHHRPIKTKNKKSGPLFHIFFLYRFFFLSRYFLELRIESVADIAREEQNSVHIQREQKKLWTLTRSISDSFAFIFKASARV